MTKSRFCKSGSASFHQGKHSGTGLANRIEITVFQEHDQPQRFRFRAGRVEVNAHVGVFDGENGFSRFDEGTQTHTLPVIINPPGCL